MAGAAHLHAAQHGILQLHNLACALTGRTGHRRGLGGRARAVAHVAQHGGFHGDLAVDARVDLLQRGLQVHQRIVAAAHAGLARATCAAATAEECVEDVAQAAAGEASESTGSRLAEALLLRVATSVHDLALLRVRQYLLGQGGLAELLRSLLGGVDVRVVLARQAAVRLLNFGVRSVAIHTEDSVIVSSHVQRVLFTSILKLLAVFSA